MAIKKQDLQRVIDGFKDDLDYYNNPASYCDSSYYDRCSAKADALSDVISTLERFMERNDETND